MNKYRVFLNPSGCVYVTGEPKLEFGDGELAFYWGDSDIEVAYFKPDYWRYFYLIEDDMSSGVETFPFHVYRPSPEAFQVIDNSVGSRYMTTGYRGDGSLIFLGERGKEIKKFAPMDWSIVFRRYFAGYQIYEINPLAGQSIVQAGCLFAGSMMAIDARAMLEQVKHNEGRNK